MKAHYSNTWSLYYLPFLPAPTQSSSSLPSLCLRTEYRAGNFTDGVLDTWACLRGSLPVSRQRKIQSPVTQRLFEDFRLQVHKGKMSQEIQDMTYDDHPPIQI